MQLMWPDAPRRVVNVGARKKVNLNKPWFMIGAADFDVAEVVKLQSWCGKNCGGETIRAICAFLEGACGPT